jgi:hypothetical protein
MFIAIFTIVSISIATALILDYIESVYSGLFNTYVILGLLIVLGLNVFKFIAWSILHKRYDLSSTYPLTAIYFPLIYIISVLKKEMVVDIFSLIAIIFVFSGVYFILSSDKQKKA